MDPEIQQPTNQQSPQIPILQEQPKNHFSQKLLFFGIIVLIILSLVLTYTYFLSKENPKKQSSMRIQQPTQGIQVTPNPTLTVFNEPSPTGSPVFSTQGYHITLNLKPGGQKPATEEPGQPYFLAEFLINAFGLPKSNDYKETISYISRDIKSINFQKNESRFIGDYYIILKNGTLDTNKIYDGNFFTVKAEPMLQTLEPYILDVEYCNQDSDCSLRHNFCTYGSYNNYQPFHDVYGCGAPADKTGYTFDIYDESLKCVTNVEFSGSQCINHKCTDLDRKVSCKEE